MTKKSTFLNPNSRSSSNNGEPSRRHDAVQSGKDGATAPAGVINLAFPIEDVVYKVKRANDYGSFHNTDQARRAKPPAPERACWIW